MTSTINDSSPKFFVPSPLSPSPVSVMRALNVFFLTASVCFYLHFCITSVLCLNLIGISTTSQRHYVRHSVQRPVGRRAARDTPCAQLQKVEGAFMRFAYIYSRTLVGLSPSFSGEVGPNFPLRLATPFSQLICLNSIPRIRFWA